MNAINIAKVIVNKRVEKGITQDELADFIGVSKSAVSKWETEQSYPDIVLLPRLAAYFNVTLDELMGYEPQMTSEDISNLYKELAEEFAVRPFDEVVNRCREIVKKYFSCFPLVFRIGVLYLNYGLTSKDNKQKITTITEAIKLFIRVKEQSNDVHLKQAALYAEVTSLMILNNVNQVLDLLKDVNDSPSYKVILSQAYFMTGKVKEAKMELQESIYINIMKLFEAIPLYLIISIDDDYHFEMICKRAMDLINTFNLKKLVPTSIMPFYLAAAKGYVTNKNPEKSLDILEKYTEIVTSDIYPLKMVKGDDFFNLIESSAEKVPFGLTEMPRDEKSIRQSMADAVIEEPAFSALSMEPRFNKLTKILLNNIEGK